MNHTTLAVLAFSTCAFLGCGTEPVVDPPLAVSIDPRPTEEPTTVRLDAAHRSFHTQVFALDSLGTTVYALEVRLDDVDAAPVGVSFEAGPEANAHVLILGSTTYTPPNPLCAEFETIEGPDGPCPDTRIPALATPLEVNGVILLSSNAAMITGQVDAFVRDDVEAVANFTVHVE